MKKSKVVVVMPAYNAAKTLKKTYNDIPPGVVGKVILVDDGSHDQTVKVAKKLGLQTFVHPQNRGYGGNQKSCYTLALNEGADIVVMIHPDYQYDSSLTADIIKPILRGRFDIMLGSRIRTRKEALKGGMPTYKYFANRFLTILENIVLGQNLSEYHTGFRAYNKRVLMKLPYHNFSDDFVFDQEILISAIHRDYKIGEIAVPVRYFPEASSINFRRSTRYGLETILALIKYTLVRGGSTGQKYLPMTNKIIKKIKKNPKPWAAALACMLILLAYGQTLRMYFYQDDFALLFKLQHLQENAGSFGAGLWERGPYRYLVAPFTPFFYFFGLQPLGYFVIGLLTYFLAILCFYIFINELLRDKRAVLFSVLVASVGYVGSDTMFRIINSWQTNLGICFALLTLWLYIKFLKGGKILLYIGTVFLYLATIEVFFIRSHSLIASLLVLDVLLTLFPFRWKGLVYTLLRQLPFWWLFNVWYLQLSSFGAPSIKMLLADILRGHLEELAPLFATVGNTFVPDILQSNLVQFAGAFLQTTPFKELLSLSLALTGLSYLAVFLIFRKNKRQQVICWLLLLFFMLLNLYFFKKNLIWYRDIQGALSGLIGIQGSVLSTALGISLWKKTRDLAIAVLFGLVFVITEVGGYYIQYSTSIFSTTHRYLSYAFVGNAMVWGVALYVIFGHPSRLRRLNKIRGNNIFWPLTPLIGFLCLFLLLDITYQYAVIKQKSIPTAMFYQDLLKNVPSVKKGAAFYFDVSKDSPYQQQFSNFFGVGSMPDQTAIAVFYGVDRYDLSRITGFDELTSGISDGSVSINNLYSFYYGTNGLVNTTPSVRKLLSQGSMFLPLQVSQSQFNSPEEKGRDDNIEGGSLNIPLKILNINSSTPLLLRINMKSSILNSPAGYPYQQGSGTPVEIPSDEEKPLSGYFSSQNRYFSTAEATSSSQWRGQEVANVIDNNPDTSWRGHRIFWHDHRHEALTIDLKSPEEIGAVKWTNWENSLTPTDYTIQSSINGVDWQILTRVRNGPERSDNEVVTETFPDTLARYVKMDITSTLTNDAPALTEFEVVESSYKYVDSGLAQAFVKNPYGYVANQSDWDLLAQEIQPLAYFTVRSENNEDSNGSSSTRVPLNLTGTAGDYDVIIPAGGTSLTGLELIFNLPVSVTINSVSIRNLSYQDLKDRGVIKAFAVN